MRRGSILSVCTTDIYTSIDATTTSPLEIKRGVHVEVLLAPLDKGNPVVRRVYAEPRASSS
jgi:hypothetical protein